MRMSEKEYLDLTSRQKLFTEIGKANGLQPKGKAQKGPNKTEGEYGFRLSCEYPGCNARYEAVTLVLANGHRYTPDWAVQLPDGKILMVEVKARGKNGFRHPSYQRARLAFDQCRIEWPMFHWRWAEKHCGTWDVKDYLPAQKT